MKQTSKYQLNLIETGDRFSADSINENMQTIEAVLQTVSDDHVNDKENPHGVTAAQVGAHSITSRGTTLIPNGSDLDDYLTPGDYYVSGSTGAATISNSPTTSSGYKLIVEQSYGGSGNLNQFAIALGPVLYSRTRSGGVWKSWRKIIDSTSVDTDPASGSTKLVTSGGVYTALGKKYGTDNAGWVTGTYTGTGIIGTAQEITLGFQPSAVFITRVASDATHTGFAVCIRSGSSQGVLNSASKPVNHALDFYNGYCAITATGFSVMKAHSTYSYSLDEASATYVYLALR